MLVLLGKPDQGFPNPFIGWGLISLLHVVNYDCSGSGCSAFSGACSDNVSLLATFGATSFFAVSLLICFRRCFGHLCQCAGVHRIGVPGQKARWSSASVVSAISLITSVEVPGECVVAAWVGLSAAGWFKVLLN